MQATVRALSRADAGDDVVVPGTDLRERLSLSPGDFVRVEGPAGAALARVRLDDRTEGTVVRLGRPHRRATGVSAGDSVTVTAVEPAPAERVTVGLAGQDVVESLDLAFRAALVGRGAMPGQTLAVDRGDGKNGERSTHSADARHRIPVHVASTTPDEPVYITEWTDIRVSAESLEAPLDAGHVLGEGPLVTFDDVGGLDDAITPLREAVELPLDHARLFRHLDVSLPTGVLVTGPSGTGKTLLVRALATETDFATRFVSGAALAAERPDAAAERLREALEDGSDDPTIVVVDELDALAPNRGGERCEPAPSAARLVSHLDAASDDDQVVVATATRASEVDPSLLRPGRFDREIELDVPDRGARAEILRRLTRAIPLGEATDLDAYAARTHGFVGADLADLVRESVLRALGRERDAVAAADDEATGIPETFTVRADDIERSLRTAEPSALREVFVEAPDVSWADVGGHETTKARLQEAVQWPLEHADAFERADLQPPTGILLYGPPGTGKTLLAKAVASESRSNFISVKGPELLDKYVGESERGVREVFSKAREHAPTVVFFDEIDAIAAERGRDGDNAVTERVVSQLLTELDGLEDLGDVVVVATTNRPDLLDDALLRAGRFDRHVHVSAPDEAARAEIFAVHTAGKPLADDVDLDALAARTDGYVGADIESVCREAATAAVRSHVESETGVDEIVLTAADFDWALGEVEPDHVDGDWT